MLSQQQQSRLDRIIESLEWLEWRKKTEVYSDAAGLAGLHKPLKDRGFVIRKFMGGYVIKRQ